MCTAYNKSGALCHRNINIDLRNETKSFFKIPQKTDSINTVPCEQQFLLHPHCFKHIQMSRCLAARHGQLSWINFTIPSNSDSIWYRLPWSIVHSQFPSYCAQPTDCSWYIYKNMAQRFVFLYYCCPQSIADKCIFNKTYISLLLQSTVYSQ